MSKSILLDSLNGDWVVHGEGTEKYWTRGNYEIIHSDNIFNTNKQGWIIKEFQGLQILGLATSGDPWQSDAEMIWNPNAKYTEGNINNFQVIAITDKRVVDISNYYLCNEINYDENGEMVSWNGREVFLRKDENNELHTEYSSDIRKGLLSEGLNVIVGDIYNFNATAQLFIYPEIGLDTSMIEEYAALPENILIDKKAYVNGKLITGTMPTSIISSSSQQSNFIISSGYLENDYILPYVELKINEDYPYKITVGTGYIKEQSINVGISTPSIHEEYKVTLSKGYLNEQITYVNTNIQGTEAASSENILQGKIAFVNDTKITGTLKSIDVENIKPVIDESNYTLTIPSGYLSENYVHTIPVIQPDLNNDKTIITISKGYINEEISIPISVAVRDNNIITIPVGYVLEKQEFNIDEINIDTTTNNPATASDILLGKIAFANNTQIVGTMPISKQNKDDLNHEITLSKGYLNEQITYIDQDYLLQELKQI